MAEQALFVTTDDVKRFTSMNGNVDVDKFVQFIKIAQDIHILNYLGQDLFVKIQTDIVDGTLTGDYLNLNNLYIKPMLIHWAMVEYLPFAAYTIANKGMFKHGSSDAEIATKTETEYLVMKEQSIAQNYTRRFIDYMQLNESLFPEYLSNGSHEVKPDKQADFGGWYL